MILHMTQMANAKLLYQMQIMMLFLMDNIKFMMNQKMFIILLHFMLILHHAPFKILYTLFLVLCLLDGHNLLSGLVIQQISQ
jgi:hypothetical protein